MDFHLYFGGGEWREQRLVADLYQRSKEFELMEARGLVDADTEFNPRRVPYHTNFF